MNARYSHNPAVAILRRVLLLGCCCLAGGAAADGGFAVREVKTPAPANSAQHHLNHTADGRLILSWVEMADGRSTARFAIRKNHRWSAVRTLVSIEGKLADPPVVLGLSDGTLAGAWMVATPNPDNRYAADIFLARSSDEGHSWSVPVKPYGEAARIYDAQMSLAALPEGRLALVWTDQRGVRPASAEGGEFRRFQTMAAVLDQGLHAGGEITLDADVCSCCHSETAAQGDELLTVYRDHAAGEIRDNGVVRWNAVGEVRQLPFHADGWVINGCPSNGSAVDWRGTRVAVAWFSAADGKGRLRLAFSDDAGASFAPPVEVDAEAVGYPHVILQEDGAALVSWRGRNGPEEELRLARVTPAGDIRDRTTVYKGGFSKWPSKYPDLAQAGGKAYLAWTDPLEKRVRLAVVAVGD